MARRSTTQDLRYLFTTSANLTRRLRRREAPTAEQQDTKYRPMGYVPWPAGCCLIGTTVEREGKPTAFPKAIGLPRQGQKMRLCLVVPSALVT